MLGRNPADFPPIPAQVPSRVPTARDDSSLLITGASIATAGLGIGLLLGWLIWG